MVMLKNVTTRTIKEFRIWLANNRHYFPFSWESKEIKETQELERSLVELPAEIRKKLIDGITNLPCNLVEKQAIVSALEEAFTRWHDNPSTTNNSIVILSSPVNVVSHILEEALTEWKEQKQISIRYLPLTARPLIAENIKSKLESYFQQQPQEYDSTSPQPEVIIIPDLSWYFLRSFEGLDGIEYLQSLLCNGSKHRFWVIGVGQVGWEYLNSVCHISAYCGETFNLPDIEPEGLQEWLDPIIDELDITFDELKSKQPILDDKDDEKDNQTNYFERLNSISEGVSLIAVQCFLQSISYQQAEEDEDKEEDKDEDKNQPQQNTIVAKTPELPNLPFLESVDQYLLYSLLLHADLTVTALAESLGDELSEVQARVQVLRRQGIIEQQDNVLKINPVHYPRLKQELASNNFIINGE